VKYSKLAVPPQQPAAGAETLSDAPHAANQGSKRRKWIRRASSCMLGD